ncbi:hypothetical protein H744_1c1198 [Photobacterium gaetbulicola Gung47]|uniref:Uncharacterized protein n=1 Tax=Photobacterium gaetbulicola Gung47 TaxID=658445 RepID=A0A0C5WGG0_9GAMM|nr:hypothetical protein H744_1c1198 [Photobacterium gaetbulicola Gung47]
MAITSAFQADDAGSIPAARSKFPFFVNSIYLIENKALSGVFCCVWRLACDGSKSALWPTCDQNGVH